MQPGNNYRAGASLLQDALNQPPSGTPSMQVVWSDPLQGMALLSTVPDYEPLFYDAPGDQTFLGTATAGTANTLVDANPGVDFTAGPAWQYVRIYAGPGAHQIAEIVGIQANLLTIGTAWKMDDAEELEQTFAVGPIVAGTVSATGWFPGFLPSALSKYVLATGSKDWLFIHPTTFVLEQWPALVTADELALDTFLYDSHLELVR